jgi:Trypsin
MRRVALLVAVLAVALPTAAHAVWGGQEDTAHPGVGAMYFDALGTGVVVADGLICSGSYAGRSKDNAFDVFLTAGHCLPPAELGIPAGALYVSFDRDARNGVSAPIQVRQYHQMPGFGQNLGDLRDLGVLLLQAGSVPAGTPAVQLPPAGHLDRLKARGELKFRIVDIVGYGVVPIWEEKGPTQFVFDGVRRSGTTIMTGLDKANVHYNQNRHGIGTGSGLCFGDSGSPQLDRGTLLVLSVTSGGNGQCNANNQNYRVDTPQAREFLGRFLNLP